MSGDPKLLQEPDPLDAAADQVIAACDGDVRAAVRALIVAKGLLEVELNDVYAATAKDSLAVELRGANRTKRK